VKTQIREAYETLREGHCDFAALKLLVQAAAKSDEQCENAVVCAEGVVAGVYLSQLALAWWEAP
jgi:hypothetical protein